MVQRLIAEGTEKQKLVGFILYHVLPQINNFDNSLDLDDKIFKELFLKFKRKPEYEDEFLDNKLTLNVFLISCNTKASFSSLLNLISFTKYDLVSGK